MKTPVRDYRKLRLNNLNSPEFRHVQLLVGWIVYFTLFLLTENLIPESKCHVIYSPLDDLIPFCEYFIIPYVLWYVLIFGSLLWYILYDIQSFRKLQIFIMITQLIAMAIYIIYPSVQHLRPETFPRENFFTFVISNLYAVDTPTGVMPSLHVGYSLGVLSVCLKDKNASVPWKAFITLAVILISLATMFVKQHSIVDVFGAIPLGIIAEFILYYDYWKEKIKRTK